MTTTRFRSKAYSDKAAANALAAHTALLLAVPSEIDVAMKARVDHLDESIDLYSRGPQREDITAMLAEALPAIRAQRHEAARCQAVAMLVVRGFDAGSIAPIDYPALVEALFDTSAL